jgi:hypothetical protein
MKVILLSTDGEEVAEKEMTHERLRGVSVFSHNGLNYSFNHIGGHIHPTAIFVQAGLVQEF